MKKCVKMLKLINYASKKFIYNKNQILSKKQNIKLGASSKSPLISSQMVIKLYNDKHSIMYIKTFPIPFSCQNTTLYHALFTKEKIYHDLSRSKSPFWILTKRRIIGGMI